MQDDKLLTQYARDGSQAAFGQLVARHLTLVYSTCLRETGLPSQAEDAAQVVFLLLARKAKSLRAGPSLAGWLYKAARFVAKDVRKQEARRHLREEAVMQEETRRQEQFAPEWEVVEPLLNDALSALKPGEREAVLLRFIEGHSLAETGAALGLSEDAARMRVARAVEKMRRHLTARGAAVTVVILTGLLTSEAARPSPASAAVVTQATLQAISTGPSANVLLLTKGVYQTMNVIKAKLAALALAVLLAGASIPPLAHALSLHKAGSQVPATPVPLPPLASYALPAKAAGTVASLAARSDVLILGEIHGTQEVPEMTASLLPELNKMGYRAIAVEIPADQQPALADWATGRSSQVPIFYNGSHDDGRGNVQMLALIRAALAAPYYWKVFCFDIVSMKAGDTWQMRDASMAQNFSAQWQRLAPNASVVAICGNLHARTANHAAPDNRFASLWPSFAIYLQRASFGKRIHSIDVEPQRGGFFNGGKVNTLSGQMLSEARCSHRPTDDWDLELGLPTATPATFLTTPPAHADLRKTFPAPHIWGRLMSI